MEGPIISIDVSNGNSHYILFEKNKKVGGVHKINHDVEGFACLKTDIEMLSEKVGEEVCVVYEATGVYTRSLQRFLEKMISSNISFRR